MSNLYKRIKDILFSDKQSYYNLKLEKKEKEKEKDKDKEWQQIKNYAILYLRGKDVSKILDPKILREFHFYINDTRNEVSKDIIVVFKNEELNDFEYIRENYFKNKKPLLYISNLHNNSGILAKWENLSFRIIHDIIHLENNLGFDYKGELEAYLIQSKDQSFAIKQILFSEIVLQACYKFYFGKYPDIQKVVLCDILPNSL